MNILQESRYDRAERITWWRQDVLKNASVLVVGAGALGNEIVKNLVLMGVGHITVADMDTIENSNLARCVLFRESDLGGAKAEVVAKRGAELNSDSNITSHVGTIQEYGLAGVAKHDVVIAGLDSREARLWINQAARKVGKTWIDGAIEGLDGIVRVFPPSGACYECTMNEKDRELLAKRKSCALLSPADLATGKVPTNVTMASVVGGLEAQEAVKVLHGLRTDIGIANGALRFVGESVDAFTMKYSEDEWCLAHDTYTDLTPASAGETLRAALKPLPPGAEAVHFEDSLITEVRCTPCDKRETRNRMLQTFTPADARCDCGEPWTMEAQLSVGLDHHVLDVPIKSLGLARFDVVTVRNPKGRTHVVVEG